MDDFGGRRAPPKIVQLRKSCISDDIGLWIAQRGSTVVLKYNEDAKSVLSRAEQVAKRVDGATEVETVPNR